MVGRTHARGVASAAPLVSREVFRLDLRGRRRYMAAILSGEGVTGAET